MNTANNRATASTLHPLLWGRVLWLTILPVAFPFAAGAHELTGAQPDATSGVQLTRAASSASLSREAPEASRDKGVLWDAPAVEVPAVILWDESGSVRRTGPGQSNTQSSATPVKASRR